MKVIEPCSDQDFKKYYFLRYAVLRKPWNQPIGSEQDEQEKTSFHRMIVDEKKNIAIAVGRIQFLSENDAQIRYMAVLDKYRGRGLGSQILSNLENISRLHQRGRVILYARENAIEFYESNGYRILEKSYLLFNDIQHWLMEKDL